MGDGEGKKNLEKRIKNSLFKKDISLFSSAGYLKLPEYINLADICYIGRINDLSMNQTDPLKLYNYMATARPVIGGTTKNIKKIIEESNCGYYFPTFDIEDVSNKFSILILDKNKRKIMGENGRRYVEKFRDWKVIVEEYKKIITKVKNGKN